MCWQRPQKNLKVLIIWREVRMEEKALRKRHGRWCILCKLCEGSWRKTAGTEQK